MYFRFHDFEDRYLENKLGTVSISFHFCRTCRTSQYTYVQKKIKEKEIHEVNYVDLFLIHDHSWTILDNCTTSPSGLLIKIQTLRLK